MSRFSSSNQKNYPLSQIDISDKCDNKIALQAIPHRCVLIMKLYASTFKDRHHERKRLHRKNRSKTPVHPFTQQDNIQSYRG